MPVVPEFLGMTRLLVLLLQLVLTVDVARVGTFAMLPNATMTPRSLVPLEGDVSENEELMKMSGLMIYVSQYILSLPNRHGVHCLSTTNDVRVRACTIVVLHIRTDCSHRTTTLAVCCEQSCLLHTASEQDLCHSSCQLCLHGHLLVPT